MINANKIWTSHDRINWLCVFLQEFADSDDLNFAPMLLSGFRSIANAQLLQENTHALSNIRQLCFHFSSTTAIRKAVLHYNEYHQIAAREGKGDQRVFEINEKYLTFRLINDIPPLEYNQACEYLENPISLGKHDAALPDPNSQLFIKINRQEMGGQLFEIKDLVEPEHPAHHISSTHSGSQINISFTDLIVQAKEMDVIDKENNLKTGHWESRLNNILCETPIEDGSFTTTDTISLENLKHLIGLPGSGKTTLLICMTRWLFQQGYQVVLFFPSIEVCRQYLVDLQTYGVKAGLLMGRSGKSRQRHAHQIAETIASGDLLNGFARNLEGAEYFATNCPLPAFTSASETGLIPTGTYCETVYEKKNKKTNKLERKLCPLWSKCGYQKAARELTEASVWLGHIASADTEIPKHTTTEKLRYFEWIAKSADVVIFDEADRVQDYLDKQGIAKLTLTGDSQSFNADLLKRQGTIAAGQNQHLGDPRIFSFHIRTLDFSRTSHLLVNAVQWLDQEQRKRFEGTFLTPSRLLSSLVSGTKSKKDKKQEDIDSQFRKKDALTQLWESAAIQAFYNRQESEQEITGKSLNTPTIAQNLNIDQVDVKERHTTLINAFRRWMIEEHQSGLDDALELIFTTINPYISGNKKREKLQLIRLLTTVTFTILSYRRLAPYANELIEEGFIEPLNMDQRCSDELLKQTTDNILGGLSGVRYFLSETGNKYSQQVNVKLQHVVFSGSPRSFMYHLHETMGSKGHAPKVLLTSATSFMEKSPAFHINQGPHYIVRAKQENKSPSKSRFQFLPLKKHDLDKKYLRYSGEPSSSQRDNNLKAMVHKLLEGGFENSVVGQHIQTFDTTTRRRKAAFVVNSFDQCELLKTYIDQRLPDWRNRTVALTKSVEQFGDKHGYITSSQVEAIGDDDSVDLIIFPMGAIGRGVNIVFTQGQRKRDAAIGNLFFLTRPHPSVDDLSLLVSIAGQASENFNQQDFSHLDQLEVIQDELKRARRKTYAHVGRLLRNPLMASRLGKLLEPFTANIAVELLQTIGRGMRNGCAIQCFFIDAAWARMSLNGENDTPVTSMLVQLIEILEDCIQHSNPQHAAIYQRLYSPFLEPLKATENLLYQSGKKYTDPMALEGYETGFMFNENDPPPF